MIASSRPPTQLAILTWNARGLHSQERLNELVHFLNTNSIDIAIITEAGTDNDLYGPLANYSFFHANHPHIGNTHGTLIAARHPLQLTHLPALSFTTPPPHTSTAIHTVHITHPRLTLPFSHIAATYAAPKDQTNAEALIGHLSSIADSLLLIGDFNAHHADWDAYTTPANRHTGDTIRSATRAIGLHCLNSTLAPHTPTHISGSTIDLVFTPTPTAFHSMTAPQNTIATDHFPVIITLQPLADTSTTPPHTHHRWRRNYIPDAYTAALTALCPQLHTTVQQTLEQQQTTLTAAITNAALQTAKHKPTPLSRRRLWWQSQSLTAPLRLYRQQRTRFIRARRRHSANLNFYQERYTAARRLWRAAVRQAQHDTYQHLLNQLVIHTTKDKAVVAWHIFNRLQPRRTRAPTQPDPPVAAGPILTAQQHVDTLATYMASRCKHRHDTSLDHIVLCDVAERLCHARAWGNGIHDHPFSTEELLWAIKHIRSSSAGGPDSLLQSFYAHAPDDYHQHLLTLINRIWAARTIPSSYTQWSTFLKWKNKGSKQDFEQYRSISIANISTRILEKLILKRLEPLIESILSTRQAGGRKHGSAQYNIYRLCTRITADIRKKHETPVTFFDLRTAYDTVNINILIFILHQHGLRGAPLAIIHALFTQRKFRISTAAATSSWATPQDGLPQGSCLACALFCIYISYAPTFNLEIDGAAFVDDMAIWPLLHPPAPPLQPLPYRRHRRQQWIKATRDHMQWARKHGVFVNLGPNKTATAVFYKSHEPPTPVRIRWDHTADGEAIYLPTTSLYQYMGFIFTHNLRPEPTLDRIYTRMQAHSHMLCSIASQHRTMPARLFHTLIWTFLLSHFTYFAPFLFASQSTLKPFTALLALPLIRILNLGTHSVKYATIIADFNIPTISNYIRSCRYQFLHRTLREPSHTYANIITAEDADAYSAHRTTTSIAPRFNTLWDNMMRTLPPDVPPPAAGTPLDKPTRRKLLDITDDKPLPFILMPRTPALDLFLRLRYMCTGLNARMNRFYDKQTTTNCPHCGEGETDEHVVCHCIRYAAARFTLTMALTQHNLTLNTDLFTASPWPLPNKTTTAIMPHILHFLQHICKERPYKFFR